MSSFRGRRERAGPGSGIPVSAWGICSDRMTTFLNFTVIGLVFGCIYALTASGLVVTYTTSGIFNFAHGAIGMIAAWAYWQMRVGWHWPTPVAIIVVLGLIAPVFGALIERVLIRPLKDAAVD